MIPQESAELAARQRTYRAFCLHHKGQSAEVPIIFAPAPSCCADDVANLDATCSAGLACRAREVTVRQGSVRR